MMQSNSASLLKTIVHKSKLQLRSDKQFASSHQLEEEKPFSFSESNHQSSISDKHALRQQWHKHFKLSRRRQRVAMRCCSALFCILFILITVLIILSVVFATQCSSISKVDKIETKVLSEPETANEQGVITYNIRQLYTTGQLIVLQGNSSDGEILIQDFALSEEYASSEWSSNDSVGTQSVYSAPVPSPSFLWLDLACQVLHYTLFIYYL